MGGGGQQHKATQPVSPSWIKISPAAMGRSYISRTTFRCAPRSILSNSRTLVKHSCGWRRAGFQRELADGEAAFESPGCNCSTSMKGQSSGVLRAALCGSVRCRRFPSVTACWRPTLRPPSRPSPDSELPIAVAGEAAAWVPQTRRETGVPRSVILYPIGVASNACAYCNSIIKSGRAAYFFLQRP